MERDEVGRNGHIVWSWGGLHKVGSKDVETKQKTVVSEAFLVACKRAGGG